ncbi:MAG TPA: CAP domain-containing protein [Acidobacteriaceae bacterium]
MAKRSGQTVLMLICALMAMPLLRPRLQAQQGDQQLLLDAVNRDRADHGLGLLKWDPALAQAAQSHAEWMSGQSSLSHQYQGEPSLVTRASQQGAHFRVVAENIAVGIDAQDLEKQWMSSAPHRANILDPRLNTVGIGLVRRGAHYFGVQDFSDAVTALGPRQIEDKVAALLDQKGIHPTGPRQDAEQTCEMPHGVAGGSAPRFVMRWEGADLSALPPGLVQQIETGHYRSAAVGACDSAHPEQGFTTYRVAVLLY